MRPQDHIWLLLSALVLFLAHSDVLAQSLAFDWGRRFGGTLQDEGTAVAVDGNGNIFAVGSFRGTADFGSDSHTSTGSTDIFVVKLDPGGNAIWSKAFGSTGGDAGRGVAVDALGNATVVGYFSGSVDFGGGVLTSTGSLDAFVASFDENGVHRYSKRFGGTGEEMARDVAIDPTGSSTVVGHFYSTIDFGGGPFTSNGCSCGFVVRFDDAGNHVWSRQKKSTECGPTAYRDFYPRCVSVAADGRAFVGVDDVFCLLDCRTEGRITAYDAAGDSLWILQNSLSGDSPVMDVAVDPDGNMVMVAHGLDFNELPLTRIAKYDLNRVLLWERDYYSLARLHFLSTSTSINGDIIAAARLWGSFDFGDGPLIGLGGYEIAVLTLDPDGDNPHSSLISGPGSDVPASVAWAGPSTFVIAATFSDSVTVAGETLTSGGQGDVMIVKGHTGSYVSVAITEFLAVARNGAVRLFGKFASNLTVEAVHVYRSSGGEPFRRIATVRGNSRESFEFEDVDVAPGSTYRYQIGVVDADGEFLSVVATASVDALRYALEQNHPNPFNPTTTIRFTLVSRERTTLLVLDAAGRRVRTLLDEVRSPGSQAVEWDGRDDAGVTVSSGVYFCRLQAGKFSDSKKMVLLK